MGRFLSDSRTQEGCVTCYIIGAYKLNDIITLSLSADYYIDLATILEYIHCLTW